MEKIKVAVLNKTKVIVVMQFITLAGVATITPAILHEQWITGPIINAVFILATVLIGLQSTLVLVLLPSTIALAVGLLPVVLAPMIPFIMISNAILVVVFYLLKSKNYWLGIVAGSFFKFLFLWTTSSIVMGLLLNQKLSAQVSIIMGYSQFFTAFLGGIIAFGFLKFLKKYSRKI